MTFLDVQTPQRKTFPALSAGISLFLASAFSIAGMNLFGVWMSFGFFPLLVLSMWPRQANTLISLTLVFLLGLFTDWASGAILGPLRAFTVYFGLADNMRTGFGGHIRRRVFRFWNIS